MLLIKMDFQVRAIFEDLKNLLSYWICCTKENTLKTKMKENDYRNLYSGKSEKKIEDGVLSGRTTYLRNFGMRSFCRKLRRIQLKGMRARLILKNSQIFWRRYFHHLVEKGTNR